MPGRKQFDETGVLDAAMKVFWRYGYEGTSLAQLEQATGLNKSSLYNAYDNKEKLYQLCLSRFSKQFGGHMVAQLEDPDYHTAVAGFFDALIKRQQDEKNPRGCFVTFAELEHGGKKNEFARCLEDNLNELRSKFKKRCQRAVAEGQLPPDTDCDAQSAMLLAMARGIAVLSRGHSDIGLLKDAVKGVLSRPG